jgi:hypothetical protein
LLVPYPPFLGFAPLDVWWRLLRAPGVSVAPRYWPRLAIGLVTSALVTLLTLPERLLLGLWFRLRRPPRSPGPVFILGYYRSGTTHLQYLLDCDPHLYSPRWYQVLSPQGFVVSWTVLRLLLLPFVPNKRPQDNVAHGADVPAEDDFALNNGALASSIPGRFITPRARPHFDRFHDLKGLTPEERERWRRCQFDFFRKMAILAGPRRVVFKSPSHTARVGALRDLFAGTGGPKFLHISRQPLSVLRSNVRLLQVLQDMYGLQDGPSDDELERYLTREYLATEEDYLAARGQVPPGDLAELRMEDLQADPVGELKRVYAELGLPYTPEFERRALEYLEATRDYRPNPQSGWGEEQTRRMAAAVEPLKRQFRHDRPAIPRAEPPRGEAAPLTGRKRRAAVVALITGAACLAVWLLLVYALQMRLDRLVWPVGIAVGYAALRQARQGSVLLGAWSALVTTLVFLAGGLLTTAVLSGSESGNSWAGLWGTTWEELSSWRILLWYALGFWYAHGTASRSWV